MLARLPYCISIPKPLLGSVLLQTAKNLALIQAKVARHGSDDTIGPVDLCTRQDALASILGDQHVRCGVYGLHRQKSSLFFMYFRTTVSSAWSNSEVGSTDFFSYICKQSLNIRQDGIVSLNPCNGYCYRFQAAYHSLPKYIIQEDPLDGAVHIGRLIYPFLGETPFPPGDC